MPPKLRIQVTTDCVARCQAGDKEAFHGLYLESLEHVHRILHRLVGGQAADLDDLVQEVYLGLWRALPGYRAEAPLASFIYGICLRVAQKRGRGWFRWARLREAWAREPRASESADGQARLEREPRVEAVQRCLEGMSFKLRSVLVLYELEELSGKEIAVQLGIPEKTVWTRLHHARKAFRRSFPWPEPPAPPATERG
jgi:RNA polymerase sigma-70 factor (ECF subfamily)